VTVNELVDFIADELNLSSPEARARIGRELNVRYKAVTSSIGMAPTRRAEKTATAAIGSPFITFNNSEKLESVYRKVGTKNYILDEYSASEMDDTVPHAEPPKAYQVYSVAPDTVTLKLDCTPSTEFLLYASVVTDVSNLTNLDRPAFPESYHDILIHGVLSDEYRRKEKKDLAQEQEKKFSDRLSDLRMFIAKSAYLTQYRGKHADAQSWWDTSGSGNYIRSE
jgi:hypothetical protein